MKTKLFALIAALAVLVTMLAGCSPATKLTGVTIDVADLELAPGDTVQAGYTVAVDIGGSPMAFSVSAGAEITAISGSDEKAIETVRDFVPTWSSSDETIVVVDGAGTITAVAEGSSTISLSIQDVTSEVVVTVKEPVIESIAIDFDLPAWGTEDDDGLVLLPIGNEVEFLPTTHPSDIAGDNAVLVFETSDPNVVTVDSGGKIVAVGRGDAVVTVTAVGGAEVEVKIKVVSVPTAISFEQDEGWLRKGASYQIVPIVEPLEIDVGYSIVWKSRDESIVTVTEEGVITAVAPGSTVITASIVDVSGRQADAALETEYSVTVTASAVGGQSGGAASGGTSTGSTPQPNIPSSPGETGSPPTPEPSTPPHPSNPNPATPPDSSSEPVPIVIPEEPVTPGDPTGGGDIGGF